MDKDQQINAVPLPDIGTDESESWVQLLPAGTAVPNDGRGPWLVKDMASIISASRAKMERGMPVDVDHALDRRDRSDMSAVGWIEDMEARDDGIWGRVAWTPTGKAKVKGREYRFISPVIMHAKKSREVVAIEGASVTNVPALTMKAICSSENDTPEADVQDDAEAMVTELRKTLGVSLETPIAELLRRLKAIIAAADSTQTDNSAAKTMASGYLNLLTELHDDKVEVALERARASGKLVPAMEDWALELATSNLATFERWEASAVPIVNLGERHLAGRTPPPGLLEHGKFRGNSERAAIFGQLGLEDDQ